MLNFHALAYGPLTGCSCHSLEGPERGDQKNGKASFHVEKPSSSLGEGMASHNQRAEGLAAKETEMDAVQKQMVRFSRPGPSKSFGGALFGGGFGEIWSQGCAQCNRRPLCLETP